MICQRCGSCCVTMAVVIRVGDNAMMHPGGAMCPHLSFEGPLAACAVHDEPWFKGTPCDIYGNPDYDPDFANKRGRPCPVGKMIQEKGGLQACFGDKPIPKLTDEDLIDFGPWPGSPEAEALLLAADEKDGGKSPSGG